jgi:putative oxidoreductase
MNTLEDAAAFVARVMLTWFFIAEGVMKLQNYTGVLDYMAQYGVPGSLLPIAIAVEIVGGVLVLIGLYTRWAALALSGFCVLAAFLFHNNLADSNEFIHFGKDIAIAGGFLFVAAFGPGRWSLDARRAKPLA